MYSGSSDGESHDTSTQRKIPPASSMLWVRNLRRYIGSGAGLGSEALMGRSICGVAAFWLFGQSDDVINCISYDFCYEISNF